MAVNKKPSMSGHDITVIGASAGGVDALPRLIGSLPSSLPAAVLIVLHISPQGPDLLPQIIRRGRACCAGSAGKNWETQANKREKHADVSRWFLQSRQSD